MARGRMEIRASCGCVSVAKIGPGALKDGRLGSSVLQYLVPAVLLVFRLFRFSVR